MSYRNQKQAVDKLIDRLVLDRLSNEGALFEAMRYSLLNGGKRIRPALLLACAYSVAGGEVINAHPLAQAIECIHTYSLIHDDLPAMDNDEVRRGKPSCHIAFGEATAILAGDALLNLASEIIFDTATKSQSHSLIKASSAIFTGSGALGMINGQSMEFNLKEISAEYLHEIHTNKTAKLFAVSAQAGAIIGGADDSLSQAFYNFGLSFGWAFQIIDDLNDADELSALKIYGEGECKRRINDFKASLNQALDEFEALNLKTERIRQIIQLLE